MSNIAKGDLVMIVRAASCCGDTSSIGHTFIAGEVSKGVGRCGHCGYICEEVAAHDKGNFWPPVYRLIKIDPPAKDEGVTTPVELEVTV